MQQKLEAELMSLAHSILKMKKGDDVKVLTEKAKDVHEKLAVLSFIKRYHLETPENTKTVNELVEEVFVPNDLSSQKNIEALAKAFETDVEEVIDQPTEETFENKATKPLFEEITHPKQNLEELANAFEPIEIEPTVLEVPIKQASVLDDESIKEIAKEQADDVSNGINDLKLSLEKEFETNISLEETTDLFENAQRINPRKTVNDVAMQQKSLQIDLNDRIAFVKNLFENSHEDFNRVISQLNTMDSEKEALSFLKMIKKEYHWGGKEVYEERLFLLVERKFN